MKRLSFFIAYLIPTTVFLYSCGSNTPINKETARYVKTTEVRPSHDSNKLIYNGVVKERREVTLSFKVSGPVQELLVDEGDYVQKGQILASIDKRDYKVQIQATEAQFTQAKSEYKRYQELYERKKLPENTLDQLKAGYLMAKSQYDAAMNALTDTDLKAPFSGYINKKMIENFQTVSAGQPIIELLDFSDLEVVVSIPEGQINEINDFTKITCSIKNADQTEIPAKLKSLGKKTGDDHMFEAKFLLEKDNLDKVKPGMVAKVYVQKAPNNNDSFLVPVESVFSQAGKKYIWIIDANMCVQKHEVSVIKIHGNGLMEINDHVKIGEKVVTAGVHSLVEGQKVKLLPQQTETNIGGLL